MTANLYCICLSERETCAKADAVYRFAVIYETLNILTLSIPEFDCLYCSVVYYCSCLSSPFSDDRNGGCFTLYHMIYQWRIQPPTPYQGEE